MSATRCSWLARLFLVCTALACRDTPARPTPAVAPDAAPPPWKPTTRAPTPPRGMVWIPEGALVAGTPEGRLPRLADQEMAGEQLVLRGFFIDMFAYPNEEGAIPQTAVTHSRAAALCAEQGKRLCTELEWERACKGPENSSYEYGDRYRPDVCVTGRAPRMLPSGLRQGCRSEFGVRDMHGGVWEWTASRWGRGSEATLVSLRGGNGDAGELIGRCANGMPRSPESHSPQVGFRCCMGEVNEEKVNLRIERGKPLDQRARIEPALGQRLEAAVPREVLSALEQTGPWSASALWDWRPINNAHLVAAGGCAGKALTRRCGVLVAELVGGQTSAMAWVWSGIWPPTLRVSSTDPRKLWVYGGDRTSHLRQPVYFEWGRLRLGEVERKFGKDAE
jgi:sulfatase modifying factor 1